MKFFADPAVNPERDGLNVFNLRAYTAPVPSTPDLSFEFEYASERNGDLLSSNAWTLQGCVRVEQGILETEIHVSLRVLPGRRPGHDSQRELRSAAARLLRTGATGGRAKSSASTSPLNSNLISSLVRAHVSPTDKVGGGLMFYKFTLDQPDGAETQREQH